MLENGNLAGRVLVIDDEPAIAEFVATVLQDELNFQTEVAYNQAEALALLEQQQFQLVISDTLSSYKLWGQGQAENDERWRWLDELAYKLNRAEVATPLIMMTAYPPEYFRSWSEHGLASFIAKPFSIERIVEEVLRVATLNGGNPLPSNFFPIDRFFRLGAA